MIHLRDITKIDGHTAPVVDCIIGGSPCQDLSIAGKREGLAGARSGLFMEQIRIAKEMREEDRRRGRTGNAIRPRYMVWENVPGAFSSNKGEDFKAVLEEIIRIAEPEAPDIPLPPKGKWPMADAYYGDGWSVAYRVLDAQFWGVPQRRRRIHLVADFGGRSAPWILFVHKSLSGDIDQIPQAGEAAAGGAGGGAGKAVSLRIRGGCAGGKGALITEEASGTISCHNDQTIFCLNDQGGQIMGISENVSGTLRAEEHGHQPIIFSSGFDPQMGAKAQGIGYEEETAPTLTAGKVHGVLEKKIYENHGQDGRLKGPLEVAPTISQKFGTGGNNTPLVMSFKGGAGAKAGGIDLQEEESPTLTAAGSGTNRVPLVYTQQKFGHYKAGEVASTLTANNGTRHTGESLIVETMTPWDVQSGRIYGTDGVAPTLSSNGGKAGLNRQGFLTQDRVRRLTPLECERLQGYPDGWTVLPMIEDMSDAGYEFWKATLFEKTEREGKARLSETGALEVWRFIPGHGDSEGSWENTHKNYKHKTKKQMVVWYNRSFCVDTDSARYKAMGNSIALPSWRWVLKRISAMYEREATMASLFDGVGGFPLIWEQINGQGSCLWASEIELFPIAVTRYRFGGEA